MSTVLTQEEIPEKGGLKSEIVALHNSITRGEFGQLIFYLLGLMVRNIQSFSLHLLNYPVCLMVLPPYQGPKN